MKKLKIAIASFLIVNSMAFAENLTDYQAKAVKELYNKGILTGVLKEEDFTKAETFSRGQIAAIIYNSINTGNQSVAIKEASPQDILILKSLIADFSMEIGKLGVADYELLEKIDEQNKNLNARIDKEVETLNKKIDRIRLTGDVSLVRDFNTKQTSTDEELMDEVKGEGNIDVNIDISENTKLKLGYNFDTELGEYSLAYKKDGLELLAYNDDYLSDEDWDNWTVNTDSDGNLRRKKSIEEDINSKKLPDFYNNFGIVTKSAINNKDTIIAKKTIADNELLALVTSTDEEDIYGIQFKKKMKYFMSGEGSDSNMMVSYIGVDDKDGQVSSTDTTKITDKRFLILGADFVFPITENSTETLKYNYAKMYQDSDATTSTSTGNKYYLPIIKDEATYVYSKTDVKTNKIGDLKIVLGAVNTGSEFDPTSLSDSEREVFAETEDDDLIKLNKNIFGGVAVISQEKGKFANVFTSKNYKTNNKEAIDTTEDETTEDMTARFDTFYKVNNKLRLGLGGGRNSETVYDSTSTSYTNYSRNFVEGQIQLTDVINKNSTNLLKVKYGKGKDETNNIEKNELVAYLDYRKNTKSGSGLIASEYEDSVEQNTLKTAMYLEKKGKISGKNEASILLGGRIDKDYEDVATLNDNEYRVFTKATYSLKDNIILEGGARYMNSYDDVSDTTFGVGATYKFNDDIKMSVIYGPINNISDYSSDIFEHNTDGIYEDKYTEQNMGSIKISVKF